MAQKFTNQGNESDAEAGAISGCDESETGDEPEPTRDLPVLCNRKDDGGTEDMENGVLFRVSPLGLGGGNDEKRSNGVPEGRCSAER